MKPNTHPENYRTVLFYDTGVNEGWLIRSCARTTDTMKWTDGQEYPLFKLDTSSASHPAYTGKQREYLNEGRVSQFNQRYQSILSQLKRDK
ncbi:MAG: type B 50S ribosomal protein L31 [Neisseriaceae bacterium]|nr:type B 50S ribosomal protein L31 [Neisseriaceae bacterium]MBP6862965.1 type B 50S ribosomal protein L31 [Neisseriaceae bacterium]